MALEHLTVNQRLRQYIWGYLLYPIWPVLERTFNFLHTPARQQYHIGWIAPGKTIHDLKNHLASQHDFHNSFVAWTDSGQVLSWRKLVSFDNQYHVRIFNDGEIRGHYEITPESAAIKHFTAVGQENRRADFLQFLGDIVTTEKHISQVEHKKVYEQGGFAPSKQVTMKTYKVPLVSGRSSQ